MKKRAMAALAGLAVLAGVTRRYATMRDAMAAVAPELRSPVLPLLPDSYRRLTFPLVRRGFRLSTKPGSGVTVTERYVDSDPAVRVLVTTPSAVGVRRPAVLMIHGGGMVVGSPQFEAFGAGRLARELDAVVVSPDYRLAPEHLFPAALDDCMATLHWMRSWADELGVDPDRVAVTGSSAGGGSLPLSPNVPPTKGSACGRMRWSIRCSTTAPPCARITPAVADSCGRLRPAGGRGPPISGSRRSRRRRRITPHPRGAPI
jgi:acetyl esterase/lipase